MSFGCMLSPPAEDSCTRGVWRDFEKSLADAGRSVNGKRHLVATPTHRRRWLWHIRRFSEKRP
jgi:hypothetical protein